MAVHEIVRGELPKEQRTMMSELQAAFAARASRAEEDTAPQNGGESAAEAKEQSPRPTARFCVLNCAQPVPVPVPGL